VDILFVNHRDPYHPQAGGAEEVLYQVGRRLAKSERVTWLAEKVANRPEVETLDNMNIKRKGGKFTLHLHSLLEAPKHEVVVDSVAHAVPFFSNLVNERAVALVHHVHQDVVKFELNPVMASLVRDLERNVRHYDHIIAVSQTTKRDLEGKLHVDGGKVKVIYNGVDHGKFKPGEKSSRPTVLWVGRMKRYKNPLDVIEVRKRMRKDAEFVVVGGGELAEEFKKVASPLNIRYLGRVDEETKVRLYQEAWALISTSFVEGWGMTVVEANACGTPAVAYKAGSLPEVIKEGRNGFLVEYKDFDGMAKALDYIVEQSDGKIFRSSYEESLKYDWDKTAEEYHGFLRSLL